MAALGVVFVVTCLTAFAEKLPVLFAINIACLTALFFLLEKRKIA